MKSLTEILWDELKIMFQHIQVVQGNMNTREMDDEWEKLQISIMAKARRERARKD